jgi:hypothetical protein
MTVIKVDGGSLVCWGKPVEKIWEEDELMSKSVKGTETEKNL